VTFRRHRFTKRERANRIYRRIYNAGDRGISVRQIARLESISKSRVYYYLNPIRRVQRAQTFRIERLDGKFYYVPPIEASIELKSTMKRQSYHGETEAELRGYLNYTSSSHRSRNIDIDCVMLVPHNRIAILAGSERIKDMVEARFGHKLTSMLKFGVSEATPNSANHFMFQRRGGGWIAF